MRYLPLTDNDRQEMLAATGASSIDALFADIPEAARVDETAFDLPFTKSEIEVEQALSRMAAKNTPAGSVPFFVGCGAYRHHVPATVDHIIQRSEFLTSYTPYQPEIAQGTLQYLFEFQTQVAMLTGMEIANASMYDGSTACAEAILMAGRVTRRNRVVISGNLHPHYLDVARTMGGLAGEQIVVSETGPDARDDLASLIDTDTSCIVVQNPDAFGNVADHSALAAAAHDKGALVIVVFTEAVSLGAVKSPGEMGADIAVGEGQSIGNALNFGGPYVGLFATREKFVRQAPGRLCGETTDTDGKRGFVLTLSTREQHIRRDKATSNICTNSGLCSLAFTAHMTLLGEAGLRKLAMLNHRNAVKLAETLGALEGVELMTPQFFNEFTLRLPGDAGDVIDKLADKGVIGGVRAGRLWPTRPDLANYLIVAATETNTDDDVAAYANAMREALS